MKWTALIATLLASGCAWTDTTGTRHTLVLGVGVLSIQQTNHITVYKTQVLGLGAGNFPGLNFSAGYASNIGISAATNTLLEVSQKPFAPIIVNQP